MKLSLRIKTSKWYRTTPTFLFSNRSENKSGAVPESAASILQQHDCCDRAINHELLDKVMLD